MKKWLSLVLVFMLAITLAAQDKISGGVKLSGSVKASVQAGGETNFLNDTFTETSDINLASHTPELGGTWVDHTDAGYPDTFTVLGATDRIALNSVAGSGAYYNDVTPPSANYCSEGVLKVVSIVSANSSVAVRMDTTTNTMYRFEINNGTGWRTRKIFEGAQTTIGTEDTTTEIPGVGDTKTMKLCVSGSSPVTLTPYVNGTQITSATGTDSVSP